MRIVWLVTFFLWPIMNFMTVIKFPPILVCIFWFWPFVWSEKKTVFFRCQNASVEKIVRIEFGSWWTIWLIFLIHNLEFNRFGCAIFWLSDQSERKSYSWKMGKRNILCGYTVHDGCNHILAPLNKLLYSSVQSEYFVLFSFFI